MKKKLFSLSLIMVGMVSIMSMREGIPGAYGWEITPDIRDGWETTPDIRDGWELSLIHIFDSLAPWRNSMGVTLF